MATPKNLDGIAGAKLDLKRAIRNIESFTETMSSALAEDQPQELVTAVRALTVHAVRAAEGGAVWAALKGVASGTYQDPREESAE